MADARAGSDMRVLVIDAFRADQPGKPLLEAAAGVLTASGHDVHRIDLEASGFPMFMTAEERRRYHDVDDNVCCPHVAASVEQIKAAEAVLFGYRTTLHTVPAHLKGWLERTMLPGVGFVLNDDNKVRPGLSSVRRIGAVTTTPHDRRATLLAGDNGRRTLMRSFRANCSSRCRRTYVAIRDSEVAAGAGRVEEAFSRW